MTKIRDIQDIGVVFGDWKLVPLDKLNWELCHRHEMPDNEKTRRAGTAGTLRWVKLGRYYSYNTFGNALRYIADVELKADVKDTTLELSEALDRYEAIAERIEAAEMFGIS